MLRRSWLKNGVGLMTAFVATLSMLSYDAQAQVKPFKISGKGVAPDGLPFPGQSARPHTVAGNATHLGKHKGAGGIRTISLNPDGTGTFGSSEPFVFTGANGDLLYCDYGKQSDVDPTLGRFAIIPAGTPGFFIALFEAEFVPISDSCTGKFKGVTGSWTMYAVTEPFMFDALGQISSRCEYSWEGSGELTFQKGK